MHFGMSGNPSNILQAPPNILHTLSKILLTPSLTHSGGLLLYLAKMFKAMKASSQALQAQLETGFQKLSPKR